MPDPWWRRWLLPERPGLRQAVLAATALIAPVPALLAGPDGLLPTMVGAVALGGGLAIGWTLTLGRRWWRGAPTATIAVLAIGYASLAHLALMPRWEVVLRARGVREDLRWWLRSRADRPTTAGQPVREPAEPTYDCGPWRSTLEIRDLPGGTVAYTPDPLRRWSPFGWRGGLFLLLRAHGTEDIAIETFTSPADLAAALPPGSTGPTDR